MQTEIAILYIQIYLANSDLFCNHVFLVFTLMMIFSTFVCLCWFSPNVTEYASRKKCSNFFSRFALVSAVLTENIYIFTSSIYIYIYILCLSVCLFACLYLINCKTAEPIGTQFYVGPNLRFMDDQKLKNQPTTKLEFH